jgi:hypothetical protein
MHTVLAHQTRGDRVMYAKEFFDLQLHFANRVADLSGLALNQALLEYTNLYVRFGLGRDFDPTHPTWQAYLTGLNSADDRKAWTYRFYLMRPETMNVPSLVATSGCFSYALSGTERIRLHFWNAESDDQSPLGLDRQGQRKAELVALFRHVKQTLSGHAESGHAESGHAESGHADVVGVSWLYNLEAYRRLFPASYVQTARAIKPRFQSMPLWGQFLNHRGHVKQSMTHAFLERLEQQSSLDGLRDCFPFQVLTVETSVLDFYDFYRIG